MHPYATEPRETGTCVLSTPHELWSFWTGTIAEAVGIEPAKGAIVAPEPDPEDDDASHPGRGRPARGLSSAAMQAG